MLPSFHMIDNKYYLAIECFHGTKCRLPLLKVNKAIILDLFHTFNLPIWLKQFLQLIFSNICLQISHIQNFDLQDNVSSICKSFGTTFRKLEGLATVDCTFSMVVSSGSSIGSAQSTIMSQPHTLMRPVPNLLLAREADL